MRTITKMLDDAELSADLAVEESLNDDPEMLLNAAGKAWIAARLSLIAVVEAATSKRPKGLPLDALENLAKHFERVQPSDYRFRKLSDLVSRAHSDLHLRAEEKAKYKVKDLRRRVYSVAKELVPLAREICEKKDK